MEELVSKIKNQEKTFNKKNLCDIAMKHYFKFAELTSLEMDLKVALGLFKALGRDKKIQGGVSEMSNQS